jgi:hypothetical protein
MQLAAEFFMTIRGPLGDPDADLCHWVRVHDGTKKVFCEYIFLQWVVHMVKTCPEFAVFPRPLWWCRSAARLSGMKFWFFDDALIWEIYILTRFLFQLLLGINFDVGQILYSRHWFHGWGRRTTPLRTISIASHQLQSRTGSTLMT